MPLLILVFAAGFAVSISGLAPKAATYPRVLIAILVVLVVTVVSAELRSWSVSRRSAGVAAEHRPRSASLRQWARSGACLVAMVLFVAAIPRLGFYTSTAAFLVGTMLALGFRRVWLSVALTAGALVISYLFFSQLLGLIWPTGVLP